MALIHFWFGFDGGMVDFVDIILNAINSQMFWFSTVCTLIKSNCVHHTQHSSTPFPLCWVRSEPGTADVAACMCVCMHLFECHPSSISIHTLLCKSCFSLSFLLFLSPLPGSWHLAFKKAKTKKTTTKKKPRPSLRTTPPSRPSVCLSTCSNYISLLVCLYVLYMHGCEP